MTYEPPTGRNAITPPATSTTGSQARARTGKLGAKWPDTAKIIYTGVQLVLTGQAAPADAAPSDPSDRIHVDREELRRIMGGEDDEPRDPFEPRS